MKNGAKVKSLIAAVALCVTGGANAAIDIGPMDLGNNSELFFSVWDPVRQVSMTRDLGIHFEDFLATEQFSAHSWLASDNSVFSSTFGSSNPSDLRWNVAAVNEFNTTSTNLVTYGFMTTTADPLSQLQTSLINDPANAVNNAIGYGRGYAQAANAGNTNVAENNTTTAQVGDPAYAGASTWNNCFGGSFCGITNDAGIGESMAFYQIAMNDDFTQARVNQLGTFELNTNGDLNFTPVPLPPAAWLLGAALVGLAGIARRKREKEGDQALPA